MTDSNTAPCFTVVIPVFNAEATLTQTIQSVFDQTCGDWELLLIDDGSSDTSVMICETAATLDSRVRVLDNPGKGPATARNYGAYLGSGQYIAFLDADDLWTPERLEKIRTGFQARPSAGCLFSRVRLCEAHSLKEIGFTPTIYRLFPQDLMGEFAITTSSNLVFRRAAFEEVQGFDPTMSSAEDQDLVLRLACQTSWTIKGLDHVLINYRLNPGSLSSQLETMEQGWRRLISKIETIAPLLVKAHKRRAAAIFYRQQALRSVRGIKRPLTGGLYLIRAVLSDPALPVRSPLRTLKAFALVLKTFALQPMERNQA